MSNDYWTAERRDAVRRRHTTHGLANHPLYHVWHAMLQRCENPRCKAYKDYGGRGITVCAEWHDVTTFITWIETNLGPRPAGMSIDRYPDNDGNYEPGNVRWATDLQQARNKRPRRPRPPSSMPAGMRLAAEQMRATAWIRKARARGRRKTEELGEIYPETRAGARRRTS